VSSSRQWRPARKRRRFMAPIAMTPTVHRTPTGPSWGMANVIPDQIRATVTTTPRAMPARQTQIGSPSRS
jgi:hypothetical protein